MEEQAIKEHTKEIELFNPLKTESEFYNMLKKYCKIQQELENMDPQVEVYLQHLSFYFFFLSLLSPSLFLT